MTDTQRLADVLAPPYYAVMFSSLRTAIDSGYGITSDRMVELASQEPGFLGIETVRDGSLGITLSYWRDEASLSAWKQNLEHLAAQAQGPGLWYSGYRIRIAKVERSYGFDV